VKAIDDGKGELLTFEYWRMGMVESLLTNGTLSRRVSNAVEVDTESDDSDTSLGS